jgi:hypothetical protein
MPTQTSLLSISRELADRSTTSSFPAHPQYRLPSMTKQSSSHLEPKAVISKGRLTVRLHGLDAPELHVQPGSLKKVKWKGTELGSLKGTGLIKKFRQAPPEISLIGPILVNMRLSPRCRWLGFAACGE